MSETVEIEQEELTLLSQFTIVTEKLKKFALKVAKDSGFTEEHTVLLSNALDRSTFAYIQAFRVAFDKHAAAIKKRDINYFHMLLPVEFHDYKISDENRDKGVQFIEAIESLLSDYTTE